jgi:hypothetical protein
VRVVLGVAFSYRTLLKAIDRPRHQQHPNQNLRGTFEPGTAIPITRFEVTDSAFITFVLAMDISLWNVVLIFFVLPPLFSSQKQKKKTHDQEEFSIPPPLITVYSRLFFETHIQHREISVKISVFSSTPMTLVVNPPFDPFE